MYYDMNDSIVRSREFVYIWCLYHTIKEGEKDGELWRELYDRSSVRR